MARRERGAPCHKHRQRIHTAGLWGDSLPAMSYCDYSGVKKQRSWARGVTRRALGANYTARQLCIPKPPDHTMRAKGSNHSRATWACLNRACTMADALPLACAPSSREGTVPLTNTRRCYEGMGSLNAAERGHGRGMSEATRGTGGELTRPPTRPCLGTPSPESPSGTRPRQPIRGATKQGAILAASQQGRRGRARGLGWEFSARAS